MKILVFSDSHRARSGIYNAIEKHAPDQIIHLGDLVEMLGRLRGKDCFG